MLKNTIDTTNELKNKVKLANTRIKETVIRGGYDFKSLDKAPERIKDLLGQYKKMAILDISFGKIPAEKGAPINPFIGKINLDFKPSKVIFIRGREESYDYRYDATMRDSKNPTMQTGFIDLGYSNSSNPPMKAWIGAFSQTSITFKTYYHTGGNYLYDGSVELKGTLIAIE